MKYQAVIAAAGLSSRMHEFKPMMCLGDTTIVDRVIDGFRQSDVESITVVTGYRSDLLAKHLQNRQVKICENRDFAATKMLDSILLGLGSLEKDYDYVFITPVDVPLVRPETIQAMMKQTGFIVRPSMKGKAGHPVLLSRQIAEELLTYDGEDGLRGFLEQKKTVTTYIDVDDQGILLDADTPADYKRLQKAAMAAQGDGALWFEMDIKLNKDDTVLTAETAQFLEMIEYTGSLRLACSSMHMSYTKGWTLLNDMENGLGCKLVDRQVGGENGGGSSLSEDAKLLLQNYRVFQERLKLEAERLFEELFRR